MPFGLTNASQTITRLMDRAIPPELGNEVFVYIDDLLVARHVSRPGESREGGTENLFII